MHTVHARLTDPEWRALVAAIQFYSSDIAARSSYAYAAREGRALARAFDKLQSQHPAMTAARP